MYTVQPVASTICSQYLSFHCCVCTATIACMASQKFDRTVVSPALLRAIDINKPFYPAFGELVPHDWLPSEYSGPELNNSSTSNEPESEQLLSHDWFPSEKKVVHEDKENDFQPSSSKKP